MSDRWLVDCPESPLYHDCIGSGDDWNSLVSFIVWSALTHHHHPPSWIFFERVFVPFFRFFCLFDWWLSYFDFRPGELNRLSADGSILLKNGGGGAGGYGTAGFLHHQTSPAFQNHHQQSQQQPQSHNLAAVGQHPSQLHVQSSQQTAAALMMNGKSPSRDLGGGSTPVLKMTAAHNSTAATTTQVIKAVV